ncbi:MAG: alpha-amylase family glycosyl hydrolase [Myxococcales bacterium]
MSPVKTTGHRSTTPASTTPRSGSSKTTAKTSATPKKTTTAPKTTDKSAAKTPAKAQDVFETGKTGKAAQTSAPGFCGAAQQGARIESLSSPMMNAGGRVVFPWDKPGDKIPFELTVRVDGDPSKVKADLWTNANHNDKPGQYDALPMKLVRQDGNRCTFRVEVPVTKMGNYRATARISTDGGRSFAWGSESGLQDIRFRPHAEAHDALNMMEVNVSSVNGGHGTLDDLTGKGSPKTNGKYTLEFLKKEGINSVWVQPPFKRSVWEGRHPLDDAGSPYATKNYFAVDPDLSARAKAVLARGGSEAEAEAAATQEWKDFVAKAHKLGMKVVVDVALNHVGHNYEFADLFTRTDASGKEIREVRKNDFTQIAINAEQAEIMKGRLDDPKLPDYLEYVAPWLYSSRTGKQGGASDVSDIAAGGLQWTDTKQLNHGGSYGVKNEAINQEVNEWFGRVLEYWSVDMGADGFRLDHLTGLPQTVMEDGLNHAQAAVDKHRPGVQLYLTGEDFFNAEYNASHLDNIQDTWLRNALMGSASPASIRDIFSNPYFDNREMVNLASHDEERFEFHGDMKAAARMYGLLPLLGGTDMLVAGDEYGEKYSMPFKQHNPVGALQTPSEAGEKISEQLRRAGVAKSGVAALADNNRAFLDLTTGGLDGELLAMARFPDAGKKGNPVVVFANFNNGRTRENSFNLDAQTRARIDPNKTYQCRDLMADDPKAKLWNKPMTGRELLDRGLYAKLSPYQVQALEIFEAR